MKIINKKRFGDSFRTFTIINERVIEGIEVTAYWYKNCNYPSPVVIIGEHGGPGSDSNMRIIPIELSTDEYNKFNDMEHVKIFYAQLAETKAGDVRLISAEYTTSSECLCLFKDDSDIGNNRFLGDFIRTKIINELDWDEIEVNEHEKFPGEVLSEACKDPELFSGSVLSYERLVKIIPNKVFCVTHNSYYSSSGPYEPQYFMWNTKSLPAKMLGGFTTSVRKEKNLF